MKKIILNTLILAALSFQVIYFSNKALNRLQHEQQKDALSKVVPRMNELAKQGKDDAIIWMVEAEYKETDFFKGYPSYNQQFEKLVQKNNTRALLLKSKMIYNANPNEAIELARKASDEGNFDAFMFLIDHNQIKCLDCH